jgi:serine-threonine kinase receptor-associated protein
LVDKIPQIRNGESGDWIGSFHGHKGAVWSIKLDYMSGSLAATASGDFSAKLWCVTSGRELHELKHAHVVRTIDFSKVI